MSIRRIGRGRAALNLLAGAGIAALLGGCGGDAQEAAHDESRSQFSLIDEARCAELAASDLGAAEASTRWVAASTGVEDATLPAYCEVTAKLQPVEGSNIGVVYRLPAEWNRKLLGLGGGGWAGNLTLEAATGAWRKATPRRRPTAGTNPPIRGTMNGPQIRRRGRISPTARSTR